MVTLKQKQQALHYLANLLENSGEYDIHTATDRSLSFSERGWVREVPRTIELLIPNCYKTIQDFETQYRTNATKNIWTLPLLYKDGKTAFVRMVETNQSWRAEQSLKNYTPQQINQMLHLRGIEKKLLELSGGGTFPITLPYYQPQTDQLSQSVRLFELKPVDLDYSHIPPDDARYSFVQNRPSIDYKLPTEIGTISPAARLTFPQENKFYKLTTLQSAPNAQQEQHISQLDPAETHETTEISPQRAARELRQAAQRAYPNLNPDKAYQVYSGDEEQ